MKKLLTALVFLGCACPRAVTLPEPEAAATIVPRPDPRPCATACGMRLQQETEGECAELQETEERVILAYKANVRWFSPSAACVALEGWTVKRHPVGEHTVGRKDCPPGSFPELGACLAGITRPDTRVMEITGTLGHGALAHEMGHVMLGLGHCGWGPRGVKKALKAVTGEADNTGEQCD